MFFSELYQFSRELKKLILLFVMPPIKATNVVVLTIGVVVAVLCPTPLFSAAIPRLIIIVAVAVLVAIQLVVFFVVADQVVQCESIMGCNEVGARVRPPAVMFI